MTAWTITLKNENETESLLQSSVATYSLKRFNDDYSQLRSSIEIGIDDCDFFQPNMLGQKFDITMKCEPYNASEKNIFGAILVDITKSIQGENMHVVANWSYLEDESFPQTINVDLYPTYNIIESFNNLSNHIEFQAIYTDGAIELFRQDFDQKADWRLLGF
jgi:hypothetical protein